MAEQENRYELIGREQWLKLQGVASVQLKHLHVNWHICQCACFYDKKGTRQIVVSVMF